MTITVAIRSRALEAAWYALTDTGDQATLEQASGTAGHLEHCASSTE